MPCILSDRIRSRVFSVRTANSRCGDALMTQHMEDATAAASGLLLDTAIEDEVEVNF
jgi:hypothetical protein